MVLWLAWAWALTVAIISLRACALALRHKKSQQVSSNHPSCRVLLIRPCAGKEPALAQALASTRDMKYSVNLAVRFTAASEDDSAIPTMQQVAKELKSAGMDAAVVIAPTDSPNHKIGQLAHCVQKEIQDFDFVINVDSDVNIAHLNLDEMLAQFQQDELLGAVWCPPVEGGKTIQTVADRASFAILASSLHAFPLLAHLDPRGLVGKVFVIRSDALTAIGGFTSLQQYLGEDMALAKQLLQAGWSLQADPQVVVSLASKRSLRQVIDRYHRWLAVIRAQRPWLLGSYPLLFLAIPSLSLLLIAGAALQAVTLVDAGLIIGVMIFIRLLTIAVAQFVSGLRLQFWRWPGDMMLADAILAIALFRSLTTRVIRWRGKHLKIEASGLIRRKIG